MDGMSFIAWIVGFIYCTLILAAWLGWLFKEDA